VVRFVNTLTARGGYHDLLGGANRSRRSARLPDRGPPDRRRCGGRWHWRAPLRRGLRPHRCNHRPASPLARATRNAPLTTAADRRFTQVITLAASSALAARRSAYASGSARVSWTSKGQGVPLAASPWSPAGNGGCTLVYGMSYRFGPPDEVLVGNVSCPNRSSGADGFFR